MNLDLKDFQESAVEDLVTKVRQAAQIAGPNSSQAVVLSAPTGAGKTVIATRLIERIFEGDDQAGPDPDAVFLWITDLPELNKQTYDKMMDTSDVLSAMPMEIIDSSFSYRALTPGRIYFLNTQKLGKDKLLTTLGDGRQYTIWQTIDNTIEEMGSRFVVIIDEAHRGMRTKKDEKAAVTIIQRFLKGNEVMREAPLVLGISATPQRFNELVAGTRTVHPVLVDAGDVRASGLLKDRIILHHSADDQQIDITLLRQATRHWSQYTHRWSNYCADQDEGQVVPLLVVQVENAPKGKTGTRTDLTVAIAAINEELPSPLPVNAFAHSFDESTALEAGGRIIRHLAPSRIASDRDVRVVFFKTALSTGWDCPQAETMMSYRKAQDATYIAQLIGRMVRTPLARRIESDESLNSVALFLPHYDAKGVDSVVARLTDPDHEFVPPTEVESAAEAVTLHRADGTEAIFDALAKLTSYTVPTTRKVRQVRRMMRLARALVHDGIDGSAIDSAKDQVCTLLQEALDEKRKDQGFLDQVAGKAKVSYGTRVYDLTKQEYLETAAVEVATSPENIDHLFDSAGRKIGEGLHVDFWQRSVSGVDDVARIRYAKIEVAVLLSDSAVLEDVEEAAGERVDLWRGEHAEEIDALPEKRLAVYADIAGSADRPFETTIRYPKRVAWKRPKEAAQWHTHIYVDDEGAFFDEFNIPEAETLNAEIPNSLGWLRNPDRKRWSLTIPYERKPGEFKPVFPDFLFFQQEGSRVVVDILDPHGAHLPDAIMKAKGLAVYAQDHGHRFGRIELLDKIEGSLLRLDMKDKKVRDQVKAVANNDGLVALYKAVGK